MNSAATKNGATPFIESERQAILDNMAVLRRIAFSIYRRLPRHCGVDVDDLISVGAVKLVERLRLYDPLRGVHFTSYVTRYIHGAMLDYLRELQWSPRSRDGSFQLSKISDGGLRETCEGPVGSEFETADALNHAMRGISGRRKQVIEMYYLDELKQPAIAKELRLSPMRISVLRREALESMRRRCTRWEGIRVVPRR